MQPCLVIVQTDVLSKDAMEGEINPLWGRVIVTPTANERIGYRAMN